MISIATEGEASQAVLDRICDRVGVRRQVRSSMGKPHLKSQFPKIFRAHERDCNRFLVVPDLHPEQRIEDETRRWHELIARAYPRAELTFMVWETEAWFLADPQAMRTALGLELRVADPDRIGAPKPSAIIEAECKRVRGYTRGSAFNKKADGVRIVDAMDFPRARKRSPSLDHFLNLITA